MSEPLPRDAIVQHARLFTIPPELRNRIYASVLTIITSDGRVDLIRTPHSDANTNTLSPLTLLLSCKQVKHEAEAMFYHINHLRIPSEQHQLYILPTLVRGLVPIRLQSIRSLTIRLHTIAYIEHSDRNGLTFFLSKMTGLRVLHFELDEKCVGCFATRPLADRSRLLDKFAEIGAKLDFVEDFALVGSATLKASEEDVGYLSKCSGRGREKSTLEALQKQLSSRREQRLPAGREGDDGHAT